MDRDSYGRAPGASWSIDEIPFQDLDHDAVRDDRQLFCLLAAASFVEITSDTYTGNLVEFFRGDYEIVEWLSHQWEPEELRHGAALKRYVQTAWPEFDWDAAYRSFFAEYRHCCAVELLAATPMLELAARCVVETGTASLYRALAEMTGEPVLKRLAGHIRADETRHYKYFYHFFRRYQAREGAGRLTIGRTLWDRMTEIDVEDSLLAYKHVFLAANPGAAFHPGDYKVFRAGIGRRAKAYFPYNMAVRMMLKPLDLSPPVVRAIVPPIASAARFLLMR